MESAWEDEEALVVSLFRGLVPSSSSPAAKPEDDDDDDTTGHNKRFKQVDHQLQEAETRFLGEESITTENVKQSELASRFQKSDMPNGLSSELEYMSKLVETTVKDAVNTSSPLMIGHMTSSLPYYARLLSRLVTAMNQNSVKMETANTVTFLERQSLAELHKQMFHQGEDFYNRYSQDPTSALGILTSGGTSANITALWVARNRAVPSVSEFGFQLSQQQPIVCIGSELLHYSIGKALDVLGLGWASLIKVPVNEEFRTDPTAVREACVKAIQENKRVFCIIGLAGSTEAGSFDDLDSLYQIAKEFNTHFHVDAAWGGPAIFSKQQSFRIKGIEHADTVTMDGHKQLYVPMGCGLLFFRDPSLSELIRKTAGYIIRPDSFDLGKFSLEGSRPANAIHLHSNLHILGVRGYELLVDRSHRMTMYMAQLVRESVEFELLVDPPHSNILLYRYVGVSHKQALTKSQAQLFTFSPTENTTLDRINTQLQEEQKRRGKTFVSRTTIRSPFARHGTACRLVALRVVIANPLTYEKDVDRVIEDQRDILLTLVDVDQVQVPTQEQVQEQELVAAPPSPRNLSHWSAEWEKLTPEGRAFFHNSEERFIQSLISPDLTVQEGIFKEPHIEKRLG